MNRKGIMRREEELIKYIKKKRLISTCGKEVEGRQPIFSKEVKGIEQ